MLDMSAIGDGAAMQELRNEITPAEGKAVLHYLTQHPELYTSSLQDTAPVG